MCGSGCTMTQHARGLGSSLQGHSTCVGQAQPYGDSAHTSPIPSTWGCFVKMPFATLPEPWTTLSLGHGQRLMDEVEGCEIVG